MVDRSSAFVAAVGDTQAGAVDGRRSSYRCEVMGLSGFQKEALVTDLATGRAWRLPADESTLLGGTDLAPAPLMHWAAGLHADVTWCIGRTLAERGWPAIGVTVGLVQQLGSEGNFARGEAVAVIGDLAWTVDVDGDVPREELEAVVADAFASSAAHRAMTDAHESRFALYTNGRPTPVVGVLQSTAAAEVDPFLRHGSRPQPAPDQAVADDILTASTGTGTAPVEAGDGPPSPRSFPVVATGQYRPGERLISTTVRFPKADSSRWTLRSDPEGIEAPQPLAYFSVGGALCYHTQLARYLKIRRLPVSQPRLVQTSSFAREPEGLAVEPFDTHLFVNGKVDEQQATLMLATAANTCFVHRSLGTVVASAHRVGVGAPVAGIPA